MVQSSKEVSVLRGSEQVLLFMIFGGVSSGLRFLAFQDKEGSSKL